MNGTLGESIKMTELLDPFIFEMKKAAMGMIHDGDNHGYIVLYWINEWIKYPSSTLDEDLFFERRIKKDIPTMPHPDNFAWRFNSSSELGKDTRAYGAIKIAYQKAGRKL